MAECGSDERGGAPLEANRTFFLRARRGCTRLVSTGCNGCPDSARPRSLHSCRSRGRSHDVARPRGSWTIKNERFSATASPDPRRCGVWGLCVDRNILRRVRSRPIWVEPTSDRPVPAWRGW
eukprot:1162174-Prymnesium_polylepis.1